MFSCHVLFGHHTQQPLEPDPLLQVAVRMHVSASAGTKTLMKGREGGQGGGAERVRKGRGVGCRGVMNERIGERMRRMRNEYA